MPLTISLDRENVGRPPGVPDLWRYEALACLVCLFHVPIMVCLFVGSNEVMKEIVAKGVGLKPQRFKAKL